MADMECKVAVAYMHDYLDGDLSADRKKQLHIHLGACPACVERMRQLETTEALVRASATEAAPDDLTERIMGALPKAKRPAAWTNWVKRHPAATAAAMFVVVMLSSFVAMWNQDQQLSVSGTDLEHVVIDGNKVVVPPGQKYTGDLTVAHGTAEVHGEFEGNLTVIDGNVLMASTAHIAGEVREIDRAVDWVWYKVSSWFGTLAYGS